MVKTKLIGIFLLLSSCSLFSQQPSSKTLAADLEKLVAINSTHDWIDISGQEAQNLLYFAAPAQLIEITAPYLHSTTFHAKDVCWTLLSNALFKKNSDETEKQKIIEILCRNYLSTNYDLQMIDNTLLQFKEKDFSENAKMYIAALQDSLGRLDNAICAKLLALAQIKRSIPALQHAMVHNDVEEMDRHDIEILASLARLGAPKAGIVLERYYLKYKEKDTSFRHVLIAKELSFSQNMRVLLTLIDDFKKMNPDYVYRDGDAFAYPAQYLGASIVSMIKNYPYDKEDYKLKPRELLKWLDEKNALVMEDK